MTTPNVLEKTRDHPGLFRNRYALCSLYAVEKPVGRPNPKGESYPPVYTYGMIKIRDAFATEEEAQVGAQQLYNKLHISDPAPIHVVEMGKFIPFTNMAVATNSIKVVKGDNVSGDEKTQMGYDLVYGQLRSEDQARQQQIVKDMNDKIETMQQEIDEVSSASNDGATPASVLDEYVKNVMSKMRMSEYLEQHVRNCDKFFAAYREAHTKAQKLLDANPHITNEWIEHYNKKMKEQGHKPQILVNEEAQSEVIWARTVEKKLASGSVITLVPPPAHSSSSSSSSS